MRQSVPWLWLNCTNVRCLQGADGADAADHQMGSIRLERQAVSLRALRPQGCGIAAPVMGRARDRVAAVSKCVSKHPNELR
jgi:DNA-binding IclR family transcriptional regulator